MSKIFSVSSICHGEYGAIADILESGGTMVYPTETVYGLGCRGDNEDAVKKIFQLKKRPFEKNFILLFKDLTMLEKYAVISSEIEKNLIEKFWPGNLTVILKKRGKIASAGSDIACRISPHPFIKALFGYVDYPIVSTSANISGSAYNGKADEIIKNFSNKVDVIVNAGDITQNSSSTIVKVKNGKIEVIRQGDLKVSVSNCI